MTNPCFECGQSAECDHHVVPQSKGGTKTVPLCGACHARAHHKDKNMSTGKLTRDALAALKAKGVKLGASLPQCRNLTEDARIKGARTAGTRRTAAAIADQGDIASVASELRAAGRSLRDIARHLNGEGYPTRDGKEYNPETPEGGWQATQVKRVLDRAAKGA
jgi:hypothetical protein